MHTFKAPFHGNQILTVSDVQNDIDITRKRSDKRAHKVISHFRLPFQCSCWDVQYDVVRIAGENLVLIGACPRSKKPFDEGSEHLPLLPALLQLSD